MIIDSGQLSPCRHIPHAARQLSIVHCQLSIILLPLRAVTIHAYENPHIPGSVHSFHPFHPVRAQPGGGVAAICRPGLRSEGRAGARLHARHHPGPRGRDVVCHMERAELLRRLHLPQLQGRRRWHTSLHQRTGALHHRGLRRLPLARVLRQLRLPLRPARRACPPRPVDRRTPHCADSRRPSPCRRCGLGPGQRHRRPCLLRCRQPAACPASARQPRVVWRADGRPPRRPRAGVDTLFPGALPL